jgi:putrescine transport system permease protein
LEKIRHSLLEAAYDLGCKPREAFWRITFPLSFPGILAGSSLVFIPAVGEYIIPELLGGSTSLTIGRIVWYEFFTNRDWPVACALALVMIVLLLVPIFFFERLQSSLEDDQHHET